MPRRDEHVSFGQLAGIIGAAFATRGHKSDYNVATLIGGFIGGSIGGRLPDILEPATSPNHRAFFHSVTFNGGAVIFSREAFPDWIRGLVDTAHAMPDPRDGAINWQKVLALFLIGLMAGGAAGYASHILIDGVVGKNFLPFC